MKHLHIIVFVTILSSTWIATVEAGNRAINGMLIGAGSGAVAGQVIGRDTESTLIGTAVGGAVGYVIGRGTDGRQQVATNYDRYRPVVHQYSPPVVHHYNTHYNYYDKRSRSHKKYKSHNKVCRKVVTVDKYHGKKTRTVSTTCADDWSHGQHDWRRDNRHDRWHR